MGVVVSALWLGLEQIAAAALPGECILSLRRKRSGNLAPSELERLEREIASTDAEIDELVYDLYGITDEDRKIIEGGS